AAPSGIIMRDTNWLSSTDPATMLQTLGRRPTGRRVRLLSCAFSRQIWHIMTDHRCRRAVEVAERFADGEASRDELLAAGSSVRWRSTDTAGYLAHCVA